MACPDFQAFMLPVLEALSDGTEQKSAVIRDRAALAMKLDDDARAQTTASGKRLAYADRCAWACTYLKEAKLLDWVRHGIYRITPRGVQMLKTKPAKLDTAMLRQIPEFNAWVSGTQTAAGDDGESEQDVASEKATPYEQLEAVYDSLRRKVESELLQRVLQASPTFFEQLVVKLLVAMGYGGSEKDAGQALGKSGDGGIDGIIKEDQLGLDAIYVQAKRWDPEKHKVSRPDVQAFAGSLEGFRARKGVFITTSAFSTEAHEYVRRIEKRIVLIDGPQLCRLLFDHNVAVRTKQQFEVKEVDDEAFDEE